MLLTLDTVYTTDKITWTLANRVDVGKGIASVEGRVGVDLSLQYLVRTHGISLYLWLTERRDYPALKVSPKTSWPWQ